MRFLKLGLHAYGPFTETSLDLSGPQSGGLHVIFGHNEAGKSTALRAVSGLLFGIGERTSDAHVHPARELKLSAVVEDGDRTLACVRRKRRKDSLRDEKDEPLLESELAAFLHGVDATLFHTLFGLDHERLKQGGQALLNGQGDVGQTLFDAGTGGAGIHTLLNQLEQESESLFKPRASKPSLNAAVAEYRQAKKQARDEVRLPEKYLEQLKQVEQAKERRGELTQRRAELREQYERLERMLGLQPIVARRQRCLDELQRLGSVPQLPADTTRKRVKLQQVLAECGRDIARAERELSRKQLQIADLPPATSIVELAKYSIDDLRDKVGIHRKAARDLPNVRGQIKQAEAEAQRILRRIGQSEDLVVAEQLRLKTAQIARIRRLARERAVLFQNRDSAQERYRRALQDLNVQRRLLEASGPAVDVRPFESALREVRSAGDLDGQIADARGELQRVSERSRELCLRLFTEQPAGEKELAESPELETIEVYRERCSVAQRQCEQAETAIREAEREQADATRRIDVIQLQGEVPRETQLFELRAERDQAFRRLVAEPQRHGAEQFETYQRLVTQADELADRLRREAARVAEAAHWTAQKKHWQSRALSLERELAAAVAAHSGIQRQWADLWANLPVTLRSPHEMQSWRRRFDEWRRLESERVELETSLQSLERKHQDNVAALQGLLGEPELPVTSGLSKLIDCAVDRLTMLTDAERRRQALELSVRQLEGLVERELDNLRAAEPPLQLWAEQWTNAVAPLGLGEAPGADEALSVLDDLVELVRKLDELPHSRRRVLGMQRDAEAFEASLAPLLSQYAPDLVGLAVDDAAEQFVQRYQEAVRVAQERERLQREASELEEELAEHRARQASAARELEALLTLSGARDATELEQLEASWRQAGELKQRLRQLEEQLLDQGGGSSVNALVLEASSTERAALVVQRDGLKSELEETETAWRDAEVSIDRLERGLTYYSDETAVQAAQQLEERAARARQVLERHLRVRLAQTILERELARYRERHQGPVLSRASELFQRLTLARYRGLRVGLEARTLGCLRADGDEVSVAQLSEGTQYQLYLALRLATLEHYIEDSAPIPLVLDDLLIHFDDERAAAAFGVLGELATKMQILYFTHLSRDQTLSARAVDQTVLRQHRLVAPALSDLTFQTAVP